MAQCLQSCGSHWVLLHPWGDWNKEQTLFCEPENSRNITVFLGLLSSMCFLKNWGVKLTFAPVKMALKIKIYDKCQLKQLQVMLSHVFQNPTISYLALFKLLLATLTLQLILLIILCTSESIVSLRFFEWMSMSTLKIHLLAQLSCKIEWQMKQCAQEILI